MILSCGIVGAFFGFAFAIWNNNHERLSGTVLSPGTELAIILIGIVVGGLGGMTLGAMAE